MTASDGESAPLTKLAMRKATAERLLADFQDRIHSAPPEASAKIEPEAYFSPHHPLHPERLHSTRAKINEILSSLRKESSALTPQMENSES